VKVDYIAPVREIPELLAQLVREEARTTGGVPVTDDDVDNAIEADMAEMDASAFHHNGRPGQPSGFGCPDCGGALYVLSTGDLVHYRCRVGHAWSPDSLLAEQDDQLEAALWTALRALEESSALSSQLAQRLRDRGSHSSAKRFEEQARQAHVRAEVIRRVLSSDGEHHTLTQAEDFVETPEHEAAAVTEHRRHSA
jgi:two-component system chemotaxis response regulator CheB